MAAAVAAEKQGSVRSTVPLHSCVYSNVLHIGQIPGSPASLSRAATPALPAEAASPEAAAADEQALQQFSTAIIDIRALETEMWTIWHEELSIMLPEVDLSEGDPSPEGESAKVPSDAACL